MEKEKISEIIELAWCDKTGFDAIERQYGLGEDEVKDIMRQNLKSNSYKHWRKRMYGHVKNTKPKPPRKSEIDKFLEEQWTE